MDTLNMPAGPFGSGSAGPSPQGIQQLAFSLVRAVKFLLKVNHEFRESSQLKSDVKTSTLRTFERGRPLSEEEKQAHDGNSPQEDPQPQAPKAPSVKDKEIEENLRVIAEILEMGGAQMKLPMNISVSLYDGLVELVTNQDALPYDKDFLILGVHRCLEALLISSKLLEEKATGPSTLLYLKWTVFTVRERIPLAEPVFKSMFTTCNLVISKASASMVEAFLPGVASLATHIISSDYKLVHSSQKIRIIEAFQSLLLKYTASISGKTMTFAEKLTALNKEAKPLLDVKQMLLKPKVKPEEQASDSSKGYSGSSTAPTASGGLESKELDGVAETLGRLEQCLKYIRMNLFRSAAHSKVITAYRDFMETLLEGSDSLWILTQSNEAWQPAFQVKDGGLPAPGPRNLADIGRGSEASSLALEILASWTTSFIMYEQSFTGSGSEEAADQKEASGVASSKIQSAAVKKLTNFFSRLHRGLSSEVAKKAMKVVGASLDAKLFKLISKLPSLKKMVNEQQRTSKLQEIAAICVLCDAVKASTIQKGLGFGKKKEKQEPCLIQFKGSSSSEELVTSQAKALFQSLINLIEFESPRFLIHEVSKQSIDMSNIGHLYDAPKLQDKLVKYSGIKKSKKPAFGTVGTFKSETESSKEKDSLLSKIKANQEEATSKFSSLQDRVISDYFQKAILLLQDDPQFSSQLNANFFTFLPKALKMDLQSKIVDLLEERMFSRFKYFSERPRASQSSIGPSSQLNQTQEQILKERCQHFFILALTIPSPCQIPNGELDSTTVASINRILAMMIQIFGDDSIFDFSIRFPIQERFYAAFMNVISKLIGLLHLPVSSHRMRSMREENSVDSSSSEENLWTSLEMSTKISVFTMVFCRLSSGFSILSTISQVVLRHLAKCFKLKSVASPKEICMSILTQEGGFFFNNLFAKLQYIPALRQTQLKLIMKSLKDYAPGRLAIIVKDLLTILCDNIDAAMTHGDQAQILSTLEITTILSYFVDQNVELIEDAEGLGKKAKRVEAREATILEESEQGVYLGCGPFTDMQYALEEAFGEGKGIRSTQVGFMSTEPSSNIAEEPTYEELELGMLGHIQVVKVDYDPTILSFQSLLQFFFKVHDCSVFGSSQEMFQGQQFASAVFVQTEKQKSIALKVKTEMNSIIAASSSEFQGEECATQIEKGEFKFYAARLADQKKYKQVADYESGLKVNKAIQFKEEAQPKAAGPQPKEESSQRTQTKEEAMKEFLKPNQKKQPDDNIVNIIRRVILRIRPYMSGGETSPGLTYCSLDIFEHMISFLNDKPMTLESDAKGMFAAEDQNNVQIPCCLAATTYEIFESIEYLLEFKAMNKRVGGYRILNKAAKVKAYNCLERLVQVKPEFIFSMGRLKDIFLPLIRAHIRLDMLTDSKFSIDEVKTKLKEDYGAMDKKLSGAMYSFLRECEYNYRKGEKLEDIDMKRFQPGYQMVVELREKMDELAVGEQKN